MARFEDVADVSFLGDITLPDLKKTGIDTYNTAFKSLTGSAVGAGDREKAIIYAAAQIVYQTALAINEKAKQNLLKYAAGDYLDNLGAGKTSPRKAAEYAVVTIRFTLSAIRQSVVAIPKGTRVTTPTSAVYFETQEYAEIPAGAEYTDVQCKAQSGGTAANMYDIGDINILVDPIAYIQSVSNINAPEGGADRESDDEYAERIYNARSEKSTTGTEAAYIYYTKSYSTLIEDVYITNPNDAEINIYILLKDRTLASEAFIEGLTAYMNQSEIKPLTDKVTVLNVERVEYNVNISYKIYENTVSQLADIQKAIAAAVENYKEWQSAKIGRDINTQRLVAMLINAGAASVMITEPANTRVAPAQIAHCVDTQVQYAGYIEE